MINGPPTHVMAAFIEPLLAVFGEPTTPDPERTLIEYGRHLRGYSNAELTAAADHIARTHKGPARWPKLAECIDACNDAREAQTLKRSPKQVLGDSWRKRSNAAERAMISSDMGQEAARDGWASGLREFLMAKKRFPHEHEVQHLKRNAEFIDRCSAGVVDMGFMHHMLMPLAGQMVKRRHDVADRVMSGVLRSDEEGAP